MPISFSPSNESADSESVVTPRKSRRALRSAPQSRLRAKRRKPLAAARRGSTFYLHFQDKDDLLVSGLKNLNSLLRSAQAASQALPGKPYERIIGFSLAMFEHANEYRAIHRAMLGSNAEPVVRRHIHGALAAMIGQEVRTLLQHQRRTNSPVPPELLTHFLVSTHISVLIWWLNTKNPIPPRDINRQYRSLVLPCLEAIFG